MLYSAIHFNVFADNFPHHNATEFACPNPTHNIKETTNHKTLLAFKVVTLEWQSVGIHSSGVYIA